MTPFKDGSYVRLGPKWAAIWLTVLAALIGHIINTEVAYRDINRRLARIEAVLHVDDRAIKEPTQEGRGVTTPSIQRHEGEADDWVWPKSGRQGSQ